MTLLFYRNAIIFPRCLYQRAHAVELVFISMRCLQVEKTASLLLLESLTWSPCRGALLGQVPDRFQMLLQCGRGQQGSVEASQQLWLIGVRMKLGITFLDYDPSFSLFFSPPDALPLPLLSSAAVSPDACVLHTLCDSAEFSGSRRCYASRLARCRSLCWAVN